MEAKENKKVVIELQNVKRSFIVGDEVVHALRGISFKIYEGEFVTIMGTSGSGKYPPMAPVPLPFPPGQSPALPR